jgi:hypothetical protein
MRNRTFSGDSLLDAEKFGGGKAGEPKASSSFEKDTVVGTAPIVEKTGG